MILHEDGVENQVAEDVVRTTYQNGELVLMDVLGDRVSVGGALIKEIDVGSKTLRIQRHEILKSFIKFLEIYEKCKEREVSKENLEKAWENIKSIGDAMVKEIAKD